MLLCLIGAMVGAQSEKRVTIEVKEAPVAEAFDQLFRAAGENFVLMPGAPTEQRLTLRLVDVPFEKALSFLCEVAGLKWERKDGTYLISPAPRPPVPPSIPIMPPFGVPPGVGAMGGVGLPGVTVLSGEAIEKLLAFRFLDELLKLGSPPEVRVGEIRCPKCRNFIRLQCPKCKRPVSQNWRFCPYDGTKLPPAPEKCPKCGAPLSKGEGRKTGQGKVSE
jgi:hypothetical protein